MKQSSIFSVINNLEFRTRVSFCLTKAVLSITTEDDKTPKHNKRIKLTQRVLSNNLDLTPILLVVLTHKNFDKLEDPLLIPDTALEEAVNDNIETLLHIIQD